MEIVRIDEVISMVGLSRTSIWRRIKDHDFPVPVRLGGPNTRAVGWHRADVEDWLANRQPVKDEGRPHNNETKSRPPAKPNGMTRGYKVPLGGWANSAGPKSFFRRGLFKADLLPVPVPVNRCRLKTRTLVKPPDRAAHLEKPGPRNEHQTEGG